MVVLMVSRSMRCLVSAKKEPSAYLIRYPAKYPALSDIRCDIRQIFCLSSTGCIMYFRPSILSLQVSGRISGQIFCPFKYRLYIRLNILPFKVSGQVICPFRLDVRPKSCPFRLDVRPKSCSFPLGIRLV